MCDLEKTVGRCEFLEILPPLSSRKKFSSKDGSRSFKVIKTDPEPLGQQGHWIGYVEGFDFEIFHCAGVRHGNADAKSRRPCRNNLELFFVKAMRKEDYVK